MIIPTTGKIGQLYLIEQDSKWYKNKIKYTVYILFNAIRCNDKLFKTPTKLGLVFVWFNIDFSSFL